MGEKGTNLWPEVDVFAARFDFRVSVIQLAWDPVGFLFFFLFELWSFDARVGGYMMWGIFFFYVKKWLRHLGWGPGPRGRPAGGWGDVYDKFCRVACVIIVSWMAYTAPNTFGTLSCEGPFALLVVRIFNTFVMSKKGCFD